MKKDAMDVHVKVKKSISDSSSELPVKKIKTIGKTKTLKKIKIKVGGTEKTLENLEVTNEHVAKCVDAILKLAEKHEKKNSLLSNDKKISLQINCIKVPKVPQMNLRLYLPHIMVGPTDEVALIVADLVRGRRQDYEKTIDHWETKLQNNNVTIIKDIIPMNKIKTEYSQYEMRRKLARLYDFFLIDGRIAGHATHCLGTVFRHFSKPPVPIKLDRDNLKKEIQFGLKKTCLGIHAKGNSHSVQVATSAMSKQEIIENVIAAYQKIKKIYPGGLNNIRSILIKTEFSLAIPIYYSIKSKNMVTVPKVKAKRPKAFETVEGELTTFEEDVTVKVEPDGQVQLVKEDGSSVVDEKLLVKKAKKIKEKKEKMMVKKAKMQKMEKTKEKIQKTEKAKEKMQKVEKIKAKLQKIEKIKGKMEKPKEKVQNIEKTKEKMEKTKVKEEKNKMKVKKQKMNVKEEKTKTDNGKKQSANTKLNIKKENKIKAKKQSIKTEGIIVKKEKKNNLKNLKTKMKQEKPVQSKKQK